MLATLAALLISAPADSARAPRAPGDTSGYWQQEIRYTIAARLDEESGVLRGTAVLDYRNNSPDTLREIFFHQYLNAFRPHSLWSADEAREGIHRFADLPDPYHAYERLRGVTIDHVDVGATYPGAPDSTIVRLALPRPLLPGDSLRAVLHWDARLSVIPRRQGRQGRRFDFAQWYPKVCVYDRYGWEAHPLHLAGELYGEFGSYEVTLDLPEDQVVAATGVPAGGDPGWARVRATPETPVTLQSDWYPRLPPDPLAGEPTQPGRKRVRFYAERVHHFAFSLNPQYRYEEGRYRDAVVHVLYLPGDRDTWGGGRVAQRAVRALAWLDTIFGTYGYPQATVVHRIEEGGTEFPMMVMNGGPQESLIFHELGHIYSYGILANNEWKEAWLDEGFTTFQTAWNFQRRGLGVPSQQTQQLVLGLDLDRWSEPISMPSEDFAEFRIYDRMVYTKAQLFYEMLRYALGEPVFRRALREYYARWRFKHVSEERFRRVLEEVSHQDLGALFGEWLHATPLVDYGVGRVDREPQPDGTWLTRVTIERLGDGVMPVDVAVPLEDTTLVVRASGRPRTEVVEVRTRERPGLVELDPARQTMDWDYLNNREGPRLPLVGGRSGGRAEHRLGWSGSQPARRDRLVINWLPLAWYNTEGGLTLGVQARENYLGRFEKNVEQFAWGTGLEGSGSVRPGVYLAVRDPVWLRHARRSLALEYWDLEGRAGGRVSATWDRSPHFSYGRRSSLALDFTVMAVERPQYLLADRWDDVNTVELSGRMSHEWPAPDGSEWSFRLAGTVGGVISSPRTVLESSRPVFDADSYLRGAAEVVHRRTAGALELKLRGVAAAFVAGGVPLQRRVFVAGADPYETFANPLLRSDGAYLARSEAHYQAPGGGNLRGLKPQVSARWMVAVNGEGALPLLRRPARRLFSLVSLAGFLDAGLVDTTAVATRAGRAYSLVAEAGLGLRLRHRIGPTTFTARLDLPILVTVPAVAVGADPGDGRLKLRWVWSLEEAF